MNNKKLPENFIKIFGTAGARMAQSKQVRASGGAWLSLADTNLLFDPGPGTLVHCWAGDKPFNPAELDAIVLSHRHLDHSNDFNVMVESMVEGGFNPHGVAAAPADAMEGDEPIFFRYLRPTVDRVETLKEGYSFRVGGLTVTTPIRHKHPVETYGLVFQAEGINVSVVTDTRYFSGLIDAYRGADLLILNVTFIKPFHGSRAYHLSMEEIKPLITEIRPRMTLLTHFGTSILSSDPDKLANNLGEELAAKVVAASDGIVVDLDAMDIWKG
ncbi:MBL fold metallo-hydrolase [Metallumcola ferriviriculae]|uniref:MBL fold metallo-hydrolase n=1 Tax=Metallumcola ferriviriculae TaxID=3039180 RepID=A0AAU0UR39_9FIRM|nr:MBL fold metallo-hydrolase [Desulfitibacteraceae bacterium MK1]